ncbi:unnamed protein product, partial [Iphiclides podalirius]
MTAQQQRGSYICLAAASLLGSGAPNSTQRRIIKLARDEKGIRAARQPPRKPDKLCSVREDCYSYLFIHPP